MVSANSGSAWMDDAREDSSTISSLNGHVRACLNWTRGALVRRMLDQGSWEGRGKEKKRKEKKRKERDMIPRSLAGSLARSTRERLHIRSVSSARLESCSCSGLPELCAVMLG